MKPTEPTFTRENLWRAGGFFGLALLLRVPFRSRYAYHWDGAQFALAVLHYDLRLSQPHAPGYFLYVMLGRLAQAVVGDPHAGLVWISVVSGAALVGLLYLLGATMFDRRSGIAAALVAATSPQLWFHSCVALTYIVDALLVSWLALWCWRAMQRRGGWGDAIGIGVLLGVAGGVRPQTVPALLPLAGFVLWKSNGWRLAKLAVSGATAVAVGASWFVPMVGSSGGLVTYLELVQRHTSFNAPATLAGGGVRALLDNVALAAAACWSGLLAAAGVLAGALVFRATRQDPAANRRWDAEHRDVLSVLALWIVPIALAGTVVGFTKQAGYVLGYLAALLLLCGVALARLRGARFVAATTTVCAVNAVTFLALPVSWTPLLKGLNPTASEIRRHDRQIAQTISAIRMNFSPDHTIICHAQEFYLFGFRHFQLHLPEFKNCQFEHDPSLAGDAATKFWVGQNGHTAFVDQIPLKSKQTIVLLVPPGLTLAIYRQYLDVEQAQPVSGSGGMLYVLLGQATDARLP